MLADSSSLAAERLPGRRDPAPDPCLSVPPRLDSVPDADPCAASCLLLCSPILLLRSLRLAPSSPSQLWLVDRRRRTSSSSVSEVPGRLRDDRSDTSAPPTGVRPALFDEPTATSMERGRPPEKISSSLRLPASEPPPSSSDAGPSAAGGSGRPSSVPAGPGSDLPPPPGSDPQDWQLPSHGPASPSDSSNSDGRSTDRGREWGGPSVKETDLARRRPGAGPPSEQADGAGMRQSAAHTSGALLVEPSTP
mmetsp:Transcript_26747/g.61059  ORF Transcript_26747/g.61059 Transcript_26747/m.61059 type:complete len:250 (+) Transcript_26747:842-1591(+)